MNQCHLLKWSLPILIALGSQSYAATKKLTTYVTEWSGYAASESSKAYPFDGSYINNYHSLQKVTNPDMVRKFASNDVIAYAFLQVWNPNAPQKSGISIPQSWTGHLHFDDLWANLPSQIAPEYPAWKRICASFSTASGNPECSAVQMNGMTRQLQMFDYSKDDVGQLNNFDAYLKLGARSNVKKVISIGGANTVDNGSVSMYSFQAIYANQAAFIQSLTQWHSQLRNEGIPFDGVDYDFEPPIDSHGGQLPPDSKTLSDYQHLFDLVKATRQALGANAYISVTLTVDKNYLTAINNSVSGGWFKQISPYVNAINLMTYDLHGAWSISGDPGAMPHVMLKMPDASILSNPQRYGVDYAMNDVIKQVLGFGVEANKIQFGLASYGRGFAGVEAGSKSAYPGFDQPWTGPSKFDSQYSNQEGMLPFKHIQTMIDSFGYKPYEIKDETGNVIAAYIYNPNAKQFVGYESLTEVKSSCDFAKSLGLQGAIMWSMDTDAEGNDSITQTYNSYC